MSRHGTVSAASRGVLFKGKGEFMGGEDFFPNESQPLTRYRSAPSSFLAALMESATDNSSSGDDDSESILSAFMAGPSPRDSDPVARPGHGGFGSYSMGMSGNVSSSSSSLMRQSSSPAGFFNGFGITGEVGSSSSSGMANHISFSSGSSSSSRFMPSMPENVMHEPGRGQPRNGNDYEPWNHPQLNGLKRNCDGQVKMFSELENQNAECRRNSTGLVHHLSLPKSTSAEMAEVDKYLQFQPCQVRAKRGCATHPRSIAERMRRTRISQRIKKLQGLFPNIDKQTTMADMLELAVEYIKDLQKQIQTLSDSRSKCICWIKPYEETASPTV